MLSENSQVVENGYKDVFKVLSKLDDIALKSVMEMCQTYTEARIGRNKFFVMGESIETLS